MASILNKLDELEDGDKKDNEVPDLLKDYVLGIAVNGERPGKSLYEDLFNYNDYEFIPDENSITDADESVIYLNELWGDDILDNQTGYYYIRYNDIAYKIVFEYAGLGNTQITTDVVKVYEPSGDEGEIVEYSVDGTSAEGDWLVIYDNGNTVDITPVELNESWNCILGSESPAAVAALPSAGFSERAVWSYNHAIDTLNTYCGTIITNSTAQSIRSIGTAFGIESDISKLSEPNNIYSSEYEHAGGLKGDIDAEQDVVRMSYFSPGDAYETFGYAKTEDAYILASRVMREFDEGTHYDLRGIYEDRSNGKCYDSLGLPIRCNCKCPPSCACFEKRCGSIRNSGHLPKSSCKSS